jgi:TRAP-type mannitol/chloroaromatic compound transport system permease small subunit
MISNKAGEGASFLTMFMMSIISYEVLSRYLFNSPTKWAWLTNKQLFGVFILFAGVYAMSKRAHIRIEMLYDHFSPRLKFISRMISLVLFVFFIGCLIYQSSWMGLESFAVKEKATGLFKMPLYPLKLLIPLVSFLFLLEGIIIFLKRNDE